jgi:hypothetical protein
VIGRDLDALGVRAPDLYQGARRRYAPFARPAHNTAAALV